jgi:hypothetical protein
MSVVAGLKMLSSVITAVKGASDSKEVFNELKDGYRKTNLIRTDGSITKLLSAFIVEPVAIISDDLKQEPNIDKILELNTDIFASYYAQAFDVMTKIQGIDHKVALNLLRTDTISLGTESIDFTADLLGDNSFLSTEAEEADYATKRYRKRKEDNEATSNSFRGSKTSTDTKNVSSIIQRNVDLEILVKNENGLKHVVIIPMIIKLNVIYAKNTQILNMLDPSSDDKKFGNRLDDYRSGAISLSDLIFANDLITKYKENKINDESMLTQIINNRTMTANAKVITDGGVGFEKFFNMLIISNATKASIEKHIKGSIKKSKYKEKLMEQAKALLVTHVDSDYERVTIFTKDIAGTSDITYKSLSKGGKDDSMGDIFKALVANRPPVF